MNKKFLYTVIFIIASGVILYSQTKTTYKYDAMNRIIGVHFADGGYETYTYDKVNDKIYNN